MDKKTLNLTELSIYIGISRRTLYNMIQDGRFPVQPIKGLEPKRWSVEKVNEWIESKGNDKQLMSYGKMFETLRENIKFRH